ncbi:hypothetical protein HDV03_005053 [Kappamyces sp. JEL0829]|nr:hypothetical protein HDV03_005053 [Kappamyces sp. JEL0829]
MALAKYAELLHLDVPTALVSIQKPVQAPSLVALQLIVTASFSLYQKVDLTLNDVETFEFLGNSLDQHFDEVVRLITQDQFVPLPELTPSAIFRVNEIAQRDIKVLDFLLRLGRINLADFNDPLVRNSISHLPHADALKHLKVLMKRGFFVSDEVIQCQLRSHCGIDVLQCLEELVPIASLKSCGFAVLSRMFSPAGNFDSLVANDLVDYFHVSECQIYVMLLNRTGKPNRVPYQTRCFEQESVLTCWSWILNRFGGYHELSEYCFDDLLLWMSEDSSPLRYEHFEPPRVEALCNQFVSMNPDILQPRHLEKLTVMMKIACWSGLVHGFIKQKRLEFSEGTLAKDPDALWIWMVALKQSYATVQSSTFKIGDSSVEARGNFKMIVSELKWAIQTCEMQLHRISPKGSYNRLTFSRSATNESSHLRISLQFPRSLTLDAKSNPRSPVQSSSPYPSLFASATTLNASAPGVSPTRSKAKSPRSSPMEGVLRFFRKLSLSQ